MICSNIFTSACNLIAESIGGTLASADLAARAPYIIASFCGMASTADKHYRRGFSLGEQPAFDRSHIDLTERFPLCDRFIPSAAAYLAAMLIAPENPELSAILRESARNELTAAYDEIPSVIHGIIDNYK